MQRIARVYGELHTRDRSFSALMLCPKQVTNGKRVTINAHLQGFIEDVECGSAAVGPVVALRQWR